jgi:hypothetical protein
MKRIMPVFGVAAILVAAAPATVDPLEARIDSRDATRFAALFARTNGKPDAAALQRDYLDGSGRGVEIFTPYRIEDAANLAKAVAADPARYRYAIDTCLPLVGALNAELRATYLAYRGLFPAKALPSIYVIFGAANSGGTAKPDAQVIGLESMCGPGTTPEGFRTAMRAIFAHETAHGFQTVPPESAVNDKLMYLALSEGTPDYLASVVTGASPSVDRERYGRANEATLWQQFQRDRALLTGRSWGEIDNTPALKAAINRWFNNTGTAPAGVPSEMGYWVGMQIARAYIDKAPDRRVAIETLLARADPPALATASGYAGRASAVWP